MKLLAKFSLLIVCLHPFVTPAIAADESESLNQVVDALQQVDEPRMQISLMKGMLAGLSGRREVPAPRGWATLADRLSKSDNQMVKDLSSELAQIFGDEAAMERAMAIVRDTFGETEARRRALYSLLSQKHEPVVELLENLLADKELQLDAIRGYALMEHPKAAAILLSRYPKWTQPLRKATIETLATRRTVSYTHLTLPTISDV